MAYICNRSNRSTILRCLGFVRVVEFVNVIGHLVTVSLSSMLRQVCSINVAG